MEDGREKRGGRDGVRRFIRGTYSMLTPTHTSIQESAKLGFALGKEACSLQ